MRKVSVLPALTLLSASLVTLPACTPDGSDAGVSRNEAIVRSMLSIWETADTAAVGSILLPAMRRKGYDMRFAAALQAASGAIGPVIPPSILMIVIGYVTGTSVAQLFLAGVVPGVLIGVALMVVAYRQALKEGPARCVVDPGQGLPLFDEAELTAIEPNVV